jgi:hypothetical protein
VTVSDRRIHAMPTAEPERYMARAKLATIMGVSLPTIDRIARADVDAGGSQAANA